MEELNHLEVGALVLWWRDHQRILCGKEVAKRTMALLVPLVQLSWKCRRLRCRQKLFLKTFNRVFPTRRPDTADMSATSCDVGFFFLCRMSRRYLLVDMS